MKKPSVGDGLVVLGMVTTAGGVAWIHAPAGVIVLGLAAVAVGVLVDIANGIGNKSNKRRRP
jgi:hypothetical protein